MYLRTMVTLNRKAQIIIALQSVAGVIAFLTIVAWLSPGFANFLPQSWSLMQASTALAVLVCICGLALNYRLSKNRLVPPGWGFAVVAISLGCLAFVEHAVHRKTGFGRFMVADAHLPLTHPMSIQSAVCFVLLGSTILIRHNRQDRLGYLFDALLVVIGLMLTTFFLGYVFQLESIVGYSELIRISPQTLLCVLALWAIQVIRRFC